MTEKTQCKYICNPTGKQCSLEGYINGYCLKHHQMMVDTKNPNAVIHNCPMHRDKALRIN